MHARHIDNYPARSRTAAAIMLMITNNLDPAVAQHPDELITYGGNGAVFQNWAQYHLTMQYLSRMTDEQTLVMYSGHPLGLFPSNRFSPRVVVTNGMVIPNHSSLDDYNRLNALGVTSYGQMTAGSWIYIGTQGILQGTYETFAAAARKHFGGTLQRTITVTAGLGGMGGAQPLAVTLNGGVIISIEVDGARIARRIETAYLDTWTDDLDEAIRQAEAAKEAGNALSIVYIANNAYKVIGISYDFTKSSCMAFNCISKPCVQYIVQEDVC